MEPQGRGSVSPLRTRRRNRALGLSKTTLRSRVHVQTVGLNAATKKDRHRAGREVCLLTFLFIGLVRLRRLPGLENLNYLGIQRNTRKLNPRDNKLTKASIILKPFIRS